MNSVYHTELSSLEETRCQFNGGRCAIKLGIDVHQEFYVVVEQVEGSNPKAPQRFQKQAFLHWAGRLKQKSGAEVYAVYEACGFGYTLHEQLSTAGARSLVTTPMRLNLERKRKNDRMDARESCVRLSRYLDGQSHELRPIRIPSRSEQQRRELGRQREFWKREVRRLENHGRALRIEHEHETLEAGWAGPRKWKRLAPQCSQFVREQLTPVVAQIRSAKAQLDRLSEQIESLVKKEQIPVGLGALTVSLIEGEVASGNASPIAKPWAVTPVVVPANTAPAPSNASARSTDTVTSTCACCWSKRSGGC